MPFYEVTFETGNSSVCAYADDAEAERALGEHQRRARNGEAGGPVAAHGGGPGAPNWAAERIAKVRVYTKHPNEFNPEMTMSGDVLKSEIGALIDGSVDENGVVNLFAISEQVKALAHPMKDRESAFDSQYKMEEDKELDTAFLEGSGS